MPSDGSTRYPPAVTAFQLAVGVPVLSILLANAGLHPASLSSAALLPWAASVAAVELLPVPTRGGVQLSLSFPILLAVMMIYEPLVAASITFVGAFDRRELRRAIQFSTALFNRAQIALSVLVGSTVFHALSGTEGFPSLAAGQAAWPRLAPAVLAAIVADYIVNIALVGFGMHLALRSRVMEAVRLLRVGALSDFLLNYLGLSLIGLVIFELYQTRAKFWAVAAFVAPLVFARQMFLRTLALEEATKELKDRERVLRALSNRMAEERLDERARIADYLHDDVAQTLFRLTLRLEMAKKRLSHGDVEAVRRDLEQIGDIKQQTSQMVRVLVRDLHAAPIGRTGLADALASLAEDLSSDATRITSQVVHVELPPPIQLLIHQIAREAVMNALKHARPSHIRISLVGTGDGVDLTVADDGLGFDTSAPTPEGHFGSIMMRERALVAGGTFELASEPGRGTTVTAHFPEVWVTDAAQDGDGTPSGGSGSPNGGHVSPTAAVDSAGKADPGR